MLGFCLPSISFFHVSGLTRRIREVGYDSSSPDPHCRGLTRGSPSPTAPGFRRAPPSPGLRIRHLRSPSPMHMSSPDPADCSSSEEGDATVEAVTTSEEEEHSDLEGGRLESSLCLYSRSVLGELGKLEEMASAASSDSSTLSPTTAVLFCQDAIEAGGLQIGRSVLARSGSVNSFSSPSLVGCPVVSGEDPVLRDQVGPSLCAQPSMEKEDGTPVQGSGGASTGEGPRILVVSGTPGQPALMEKVGGALPVDAETIRASRLPLCVGESFPLVAADSELRLLQIDEMRLVVSSSSQIYANFGGLVVAGEEVVVAGGCAVVEQQGAVHARDKVGLSPTVPTVLHSLLVAGSHLQVADEPTCASHYHLLGGSVGHVSDGLVSEGGRVSPVAREALRLQHADGLRQPSSSPVEPVIGSFVVYHPFP
ncbi:hypothetical protein Dimus_026755 [Dionaea muscipula]